VAAASPTSSPTPSVPTWSAAPSNSNASGGDSVAQLTDELAERGLRGRGRRDRPEKPLVVSSIADLLANPVYTGVVEWQGVTYPGQHQPLVDEATFHRVQQLRATPRPAPARQSAR
jgi:hypothetical protein